MVDSSSAVWGLDIGHSSIKAVRLDRAPGGGVVVLGYAIEPIPSGDDVDRDEAVVEALTALAQREEFRNTPVYTALSGRQVLTRSINVPVINENKVNRMVELEARQQIPGDFEEIRWGYHLSPGLDGASNDVALFAARKEIVDDLISKCNRSGVNLVGISVTSLAVYNFVQFDQEFEEDESVIVLDVGAENTDLVVYQGDTLWMRSLGVSGNDITRTFMKKFRVSFDEAEQLKCQVGDSRQADRILKVVESSLTELTGETQRSLGFYKSQNSHARFENVVVSGNTFLLPGLTQFMADRLGYAIIALIDLEKIEVTGGLDREHFLEDLQSLGVAMGLGLQGLGTAKADVNLLPSALQLQSLLKTKRWAMIALLIILPIVFLANHFINQQRLDESVAKWIEMDENIRKIDKARKAADTASKGITPAASDAAQFESYAEQIGLLHNIEQGVFDAVQAVTAQDGLLKPGAAKPPPKPDESPTGTPIPQALYLDRIEIRDVPPSEGSPFLQHRQARTVIVDIRVPDYTERSKVVKAFTAALEGIKQSPGVWQAINSDQEDLPADAEIPALFDDIRQEGWKPYAEEWTYMNRFYRNPETQEIEPRTEPVKDAGRIFTFQCPLRLKTQ